MIPWRIAKYQEVTPPCGSSVFTRDDLVAGLKTEVSGPQMEGLVFMVVGRVWTMCVHGEFLVLPEHGPAELRDSTSSLSATCFVCGKMVGAEPVDVCWMGLAWNGGLHQPEKRGNENERRWEWDGR